MTDYLTTAEAAQRLGVSVVGLRRMIERGDLETTRFGRSHMIDPAVLDALPPRKIGRPRKPDALPASVARRGKSR